ncbi:MAG: YegP family protein [Smithellaceae bacterium]
MAGTFELKKGDSGQFMFNLKAANGQIILTSQQYKAKIDAQNGIESVRKNAGNDANFERKTSSKKEPYFVLKATNGQTIGKSEMYKTAAAMENGITSVKTNAPDAKVADSAA